MQTQHILSANILDILFDGRNKNYGAYDLRKNYNKRITYALSGTYILCLLFAMGSIFANGKKASIVPIFVKDIELKNMKDKNVAKPEKPNELPQQKTKERLKTVTVNIPVIAPDDQVKPDEIIKSIDEIENVRIGAATVDGKDVGADVVAPPINNSTIGNGGEHKIKDIEEGTTAITVEIVAQFPGGLDAWKKYLERNLNAGLPAENGAASGKYSVIISFVVDKEGNISEVKAENTPGFGTEAEAIRIIKKSPKWQPAIQNGRKVAYRVKQQVTFQVDDNG